MLRINREAIKRLPESQQAEALAILTEYEKALKHNPLLGYQPHPKQVSFHESREPLKAFLGGNRSGKTTAGILDDLIQCVDESVLPDHLLRYKKWQPPFYCRIIVPDFTSTLEGVIFQKLREWSPKSQLVGDRFDKAYEKSTRKLSFKNGSTIDFLTFEQDLDKFGGAAKHRIHYDEEPPKDIRRESMMRLIDYGGDELFTMTPLHGMCVDGKTEILTRHGWGTHQDIAEGVPVLTYNCDTGLTEWQPILAIHREKGYAGSMYRGKGHLDTMFTGDHRWATDHGILPFGEMTTKHRVRVAARHENVNVEGIEDQPTFHELVGWVMAEGSVVANENKVVIYQSFSRYPENCERIELCLRSAEAQYHVADRPYENDGVIRRYVITGDVARRIKFIVGYPKCLPPRYVTSLSRLSLLALYDGLIRGDGHVTKTGSWHFTTIDKGLADSVQIVAVLLGWRTNIRHFQQNGKRVWRVTGSKRQEITDFKRRVEECDSPGFVWCPKTRNGTWVARRGGTAYITGNSWMYDEIWEPWTKGKLSESTLVLVDMDDNPYLDSRTKTRALAGLTKEEKEARKSGKFVHFAGMIYDEFSRNFHVIPEVAEVPPVAKIFKGIDPGMRHMAALLWAYLTPEDVLVVFDELALQGHNIAQVCEAAKLVDQKWGQHAESGAIIPIQAEWNVIDPAARNVMHNTGRSDQMEYTKNGIVTILGQNSKTAGISAVKQRLQTRRLLITANCQQTIDQFRKYRWKTSTRSEDDPKEEPVKKDDHLLDALRYIVMSMPQPPSVDEDERPMTPLEKAMYEDMRGANRTSIAKTPMGGVFA